jgi:hypothetical protein
MAAQDRISVVVGQQKKILINQSGVTAPKRLSDLIDVDLSAQEDGSILIYDEIRDKYVAGLILEKQIINGGQY